MLLVILACRQGLVVLKVGCASEEQELRVIEGLNVLLMGFNIRIH